MEIKNKCTIDKNSSLKHSQLALEIIGYLLEVLGFTRVLTLPEGVGVSNNVLWWAALTK